MDTLVGILMDLMGFTEGLVLSEKFGRKNVIRVLSGEGIMYVIYMF